MYPIPSSIGRRIGATQLSLVLLGGRPPHSEMVVLSAQTEFGGNTGSSYSRVLCGFKQLGVQGDESSPLPDCPHEDYDPGLARR